MLFDIDSMDLASMRDLQASYRRLRWFVAGVTLLGIVTSVVLNVLHAPPRWDMQMVGALAPVAVFLSIEMVSRIPVTGRLLGVGRILASLAVGAGAGYVSYLQQVDYLSKGGYESTIAHIFPGIIDGLTVVATLSLVEVTRVLRTLSVAIGKQMATVSVPVPPVTPAVAPPVEPAPVVEVQRPAVTVADAEPVIAPRPARRPRRPRATTEHPGVQRKAGPATVEVAIEEVPAGQANDAPAEVPEIVSA